MGLKDELQAGVRYFLDIRGQNRAPTWPQKAPHLCKIGLTRARSLPKAIKPRDEVLAKWLELVTLQNPAQSQVIRLALDTA